MCVISGMEEKKSVKVIQFVPYPDAVPLKSSLSPKRGSSPYSSCREEPEISVFSINLATNTKPKKCGPVFLPSALLPFMTPDTQGSRIRGAVWGSRFPNKEVIESLLQQTQEMRSVWNVYQARREHLLDEQATVSRVLRLLDSLDAIRSFNHFPGI